MAEDLAQKAKRQLAKTSDGFRWVRPEVYPLLAALGIGCAFCAYSFGRNLMHNPGITLNKQRRSGERELTEEEARKYHKSVYRSMADSRKGKQGIIPDI
ncbi:hypothetical protein WJX74_004559 [Apatococcus lobatus]|uniref:Uncharacterized protein n=1 Tax=Apatococcus lobatus TaxID=904363 RepID=A0AAW1S1E5_9CHLO